MHTYAVFFPGNGAGNRRAVIRNILIMIIFVFLQFAELVFQFLMRNKRSVVNDGDGHPRSRKAQRIRLRGPQSIVSFLIGGVFRIGRKSSRQRQKKEKRKTNIF